MIFSSESMPRRSLQATKSGESSSDSQLKSLPVTGIRTVLALRSGHHHGTPCEHYTTQQMPASSACWCKIPKRFSPKGVAAMPRPVPSAESGVTLFSALIAYMLQFNLNLTTQAAPENTKSLDFGSLGQLNISSQGRRRIMQKGAGFVESWGDILRRPPVFLPVPSWCQAKSGPPKFGGFALYIK